jgi:hypothetical protein
LKFNLDIDPEDIISLAIHKKDGSEYLSSESVLRDIIFNDSVCIFQDINSLFMVYHEKAVAVEKPQQQEQPQTRKIYLNSTTKKNKNTSKTKINTKKLQILVD